MTKSRVLSTVELQWKMEIHQPINYEDLYYINNKFDRFNMVILIGVHHQLLMDVVVIIM
jgi:hypothetical protein